MACPSSQKGLNFGINAILHVFILLLIVSTFYFVYVSQLSRNKFQGQIKDIIDDNLIPFLNKVDSKHTIKTILQGINLDKISEYYNRPNEATVLENMWLLKSTVIILIAVFLLIVASIVIIGTICRSLPLLSILKENVILFSLVGVVEITFFLYVAKNYVPTKPSLVMDTIVETLNKELSE